MRKKIVVLSGAGMSAESGISTFRDSGGLWEQHDIMEVASPQGWARDPERVLHFYNKRRSAVLQAEPNAAHKALVRLEEKYEVQVITQNIDNLHEKAGSSKVLHLHGEILKARSSGNQDIVLDWDRDILPGDKCPAGYQLRPHVVWFGEEVPMMEPAAALCAEADIFLVIGTSLVVYPAASLLHFVPGPSVKYLIDPNIGDFQQVAGLKMIGEKAGTGVPKLVDELLE